MKAKARKLAQRLKKIKEFLATRVEQESRYRILIEELDRLIEQLDTEKPVVKIVSESPQLAQRLKELSEEQTILRSRYQFQTVNLAIATPSITPAALIYRSSAAEEIRYPLEKQQRFLVGRSINSDTIIPPSHPGVSRQHAAICASDSGWEICDLNSTNGVYVNEQKLEKNCRTLEDGDRIWLGKPDRSTSVKLIFQCDRQEPQQEDYNAESPSKTTSTDLLGQQLFKNCHLLCLVYNPILPISPIQKHLIEQASCLPILKLSILIAENTDPSRSSVVETNLTFLQTWLQSHERSSLLQLEEYHQFLVQFIGEIERAYFEKIRTKVFQKIKQTFQRDYQEITTDAKLNKLEKVLKNINQNKEKVFRQIRQNINETKLALLNPFVTTSFLYKLQKFIDNLEVSQKKNGEQIYLCLSIEETSVINFCQQELTNWIEEEWNKICNLYGEGGLNSFYDRSQTALGFISHLHSKPILFQSSDVPTFTVNHLLDASVLEESSKIFYGSSSLYKELVRFGTVATIGVGFYLVTGTVVGFMLIVFQVVNIFFRKEAEKHKLQEKQETLKRTLNNKYQIMARLLTEKTISILMMALEEEKQQFQENLEAIAQKTREKLSDIETAKNNLKIERTEVYNLLRNG